MIRHFIESMNQVESLPAVNNPCKMTYSTVDSEGWVLSLPSLLVKSNHICQFYSINLAARPEFEMLSALQFSIQSRFDDARSQHSG